MNEVTPVTRIWTALAMRMGYTSDKRQRDEILAAVYRMAWTRVRRGESLRFAFDDNRAAGTIVAAVDCCRSPLRSIGISELSGGRCLIGFQDCHEWRHFVVDMGAEAIHVLSEVPADIETLEVA